MESILFELGLSWTLSKLLPYILMVLIGGLIFYWAVKRSSKTWVKVFAGVFIPIPFVIYFAIVPIYIGDFSNDSKSIVLSDQNSTLQKGHLSVLTIPGCPYCAEALQTMKKLKDRNENLLIDYVVCYGDSSDINWYADQAEGAVNVILTDQNEEMSKLAEGRYPTFVWVQKDAILTWSNDAFGVRALDQIEDLVE